MFSVDLVNPVILVIFVAVALVFMSLRIVKEYDRGVIFFLGKVTAEVTAVEIKDITLTENMQRAMAKKIAITNRC